MAWTYRFCLLFILQLFHIKVAKLQYQELKKVHIELRSLGRLYQEYGLWELVRIAPETRGILSLTCKTYYSSNSSLFYYEYCSVGCCGTERSLQCCAAQNTGAIVGGVVGAVLFFLFVGGVSFICWQNSKKKKNTNIDVEPEIDELGYELEVMGEMSPYPTERDNFRSPLSPSHLQGDFRQQPGVTDTETFPGHYGHPPPEYSEEIPPMSPPPTYRERETTQLSNDERY